MECRTAGPLLGVAMDGELDPLQESAVSRHLASCPDCRRRAEAEVGWRDMVRGGADYFAAPERLRAGLAGRIAPAKPWRRPWRAIHWPTAGASIAASLMVAAISALTISYETRPADTRAYGSEVVAAHVRSLMVDHLTDVPSSDQHTVKPWFVGKLDISPPVVDLTEGGFPLLGGRLDYIGSRPAAALVYGRHGHRINLFLWRSTDARESPPVPVREDGFELVGWRVKGIEYRAVSDLNAAELADFVTRFRGAAGN